MGVLLLEVLILEFLAVDGLAASAIFVGEVTTLGHEVIDDSVEGASLVAKAFLASAELPEVLGSLGDDIVIELEDDAASLAATNVDVEEHLGHVDLNIIQKICC